MYVHVLIRASYETISDRSDGGSSARKEPRLSISRELRNYGWTRIRKLYIDRRKFRNFTDGADAIVIARYDTTWGCKNLLAMLS